MGAARTWISVLWIAAFVGGCHRDTDASSAGAQAVAPSAPSSAPPVEAATTGIVWALEGKPSTTFPMAKRGEFELWIVAHNLGPDTEDTARNGLRYRVNGQESLMLVMAFNNGARERTWSALPPGQTLREARGGTTESDVGESLFPTPGAYHLTIEMMGRVVAALDVRVLP